mmetsp:Transcript_9451/g.28856  ORF Transcript_9451/g.28856 Transcript_9451/m.28856 type:complete len:234 (-) Transcript_9451:492-1193(-)
MTSQASLLPSPMASLSLLPAAWVSPVRRVASVLQEEAPWALAAPAAVAKQRADFLSASEKMAARGSMDGLASWRTPVEASVGQESSSCWARTQRMPVWSRLEKLLLREEKKAKRPARRATRKPASKYGKGLALSLAQLRGWFSRSALDSTRSNSASVRHLRFWRSSSAPPSDCWFKKASRRTRSTQACASSAAPASLHSLALSQTAHGAARSTASFDSATRVVASKEDRVAWA